MEQVPNLESLLVRYFPQKCHFPDFEQNAEKEATTTTISATWIKVMMKKITQVLESIGCADSEQHKIKSFDSIPTNEFEVDIGVAIGGGEESIMTFKLNIHSDEYVWGLKAALLLLRKEGFLARNEDHGTFELEFSSLNSFVRLDCAAISALNLLPHRDDLSKEANLHGILDRCVSRNIGSRLLMKWIRQPLVHLQQIKTRQEKVTCFLKNNLIREELRTLLRNTPDLDRLSMRFIHCTCLFNDCHK